MEINNVGYVNFQGTKQKVQCEGESVKLEQKNAEASANSALGNYGRAFVNMSFKGNIQNFAPIKPEIKELTDEEFEEYKKKLDEKIETLPPKIQEIAKEWAPNKLNIFVVDKILSDERLYANADVMQNALYIIYGTRSKENADAKISVMDKMLSDGKLLEIESVKENAGDIIHYTNSKERAEVVNKLLSDERLYANKNVMQNARGIIRHAGSKEKAEIADKILSDEKLYTNESVMQNAGDIIHFIDSKEQTEVVNKILSEEKLYNNKSIIQKVGDIIHFIDSKEKADAKISVIDKLLSSDGKLLEIENIEKCAGDIIRRTDSKEKADAKISVIDKILSDEKLYTNENAMKYAGEIIYFTSSKEQAEIANKLLSDEKLYTNENIMNHAGDIIRSINSKERADIKISIIDKLLSDERLYGNEDVMNNAGEIIYYSGSKESADAKINIIDKLLSDEKLCTNENIMNHAGDIIRSINSKERADAKINIIDKLLSDEKLCTNENIMNHAGDIIRSINSKEEADVKISIMNGLLSSDGKLLESESVKEKAGDIIRYTNSKWRAGAKISVMDKISSDERLYGNEDFMENAGDIISSADSKEKADIQIELIEKFNKESLLDIEELVSYLGLLLVGSKDANEEIERLIDLKNNNMLDKSLDNVRHQKQLVLKNPDIYVNGEYENEEDKIKDVEWFFVYNTSSLLAMSSVFDKEAMNYLLRMRFEDAEEYMKVFNKLEKEDVELLDKLTKSSTIDNKPMMPTQKIAFIDLISGYNANNLDKSKIHQMAQDGKIDIAKLQMDLFKGVLQNCGMDEKEISKIPKEKLTSWDLRYIHGLAKTINDAEDKTIFKDLLYAANFDDFKRYTQDESNIYGKTNARTKEIFEENNMDYDKWLNPNSENNIKFIAKDSNQEQLEQVISNLTEDIEALRETALKNKIDKQYKDCIKDNDFVIPNKYSSSKAKLQEFINNLLKYLESDFERSERNLNNPEKKEIAQKIVTVKSHLKQRLDDIKGIKDSKSKKTLDLTIKMWDRIPQKDLFQGNYSTCCTAMGDVNANTMPHQIMDSAYNMIELVDNKTEDVIGNALCYFAKNESNEPCFIIDNIEIKNSRKPSDEVGRDIRNKMAEFAKKVSKDVTGKDDVKIYMSNKYNDVPYNDLESHEEKITLLGDTDCDEIYMDLFDGWVDKKDYTKQVKLLEIK